MKFRKTSSTVAVVLCSMNGLMSADSFVLPRQSPLNQGSSNGLISSSLQYSFDQFHPSRWADREERRRHKRRKQQNNKKNSYKKENRRGETSFFRKANQFSKESEKEKTWLKQTSDQMLNTEPGSLKKGKWHELVSLLKGWSRRSKFDEDAPRYVEQLLLRLTQERSAGNPEAAVKTELYNILLDTWACAALFMLHDNPETASKRAREILHQFQDGASATANSSQNDEHPALLQPDEQSFSIVFDVVNRIEGPKETHSLVGWMEKLYLTGKNVHAKPTIKYYRTLLDSYANSRDDSAGSLAEDLVRHMKSTGIVEPDTVCYNLAIKAWLRARKGRQSAEHAQQILEEMDAPPDIITYSSAIAAWGASGMRSHAVDSAEKLLQELLDSDGLEPNTVVMNTVMSTWVKSKDLAAPKRTQELLELMEKKRGGSKCRPDLISYNTHVHALSQHGSWPGYAQKANDVMDRMERAYEQGKVSFRPNLFTYNLVIDAWSRSDDPEAAWNAVRVLRSLIASTKKPDPDTYSFNQAFSALAKSEKKGAASMAVQLLQYMEDAHRLKMHKSVKPDVIGYTSVILALTRSQESDAAERAEAILRRMKERYQQGEVHMKPNRACFNAIIECWAKSDQGTYAARRAEALLQEMDELCANGLPKVAPNTYTYNAVLKSWEKSGTRCCGNQAQKHLERMWKLQQSGDSTVAPDDLSFKIVINAISKSESEAKAQKALRLLRRMDKMYQSGYESARPNEDIYTGVLSSCAFPARHSDFKTRRKALDTAIFTLQELQSSQYGRADDVAYATFMKACANLALPPSQKDGTAHQNQYEEEMLMLREVIQETFKQCCEDGQVGETFLEHLKIAAPKDLYMELLTDAMTNRIPDCQASSSEVKDCGPDGYNKDSALELLEQLPYECRCNVLSTTTE